MIPLFIESEYVGLMSRGMVWSLGGWRGGLDGLDRWYRDIWWLWLSYEKVDGCVVSMK
jgi:hypothetical protein